MSYFNKLKDVEIELPNLGSRFGGEYRLEAFKGFEFPRRSGIIWEYPGTRRVALDWFGNIVTNIGLDFYGTNLFGMDFGHVGTDNTPELATDTQLGAFVAGVADSSQTAAAQASAPFFGSLTYKYRFLAGFGGGAVNINEVGVGRTVTTGNLSSRALTVDGGGSPATVPVLGDEFLDLFYKRRNYPAHIVEATGAPNDLTGSIDVSGTSYNYTVRPMMLTLGGGTSGSGSAWGWGSGLNSDFNSIEGFGFNTFMRGIALDETAVLGAVTGSPTGAASASTDTGRQTYIGSSNERELWYQWGEDNANFSVGIGGLVLKTRLGAYQMVFDVPIPKVVGQTFTYFHNFSWDRKVTWV